MKRPLKNALSLFAGDVGSRVLGFLITVYLARVLESSVFGIINIGLSVLGYLALLANPGIQLLETRNTAAAVDPNGNRVNIILSLRLILSVGLLIAATICSWLLISSSTRESLVLFSVSLVPLSLFLDWFFYGKEQFGTISIAKVVNYVVYGGLVLILVHSATDAVWVPVGFAAGNFAATLFLFIVYRRGFGEFRFLWKPSEWKTILTSGIPIGFAMFLAQSAMNLPPIAIGLLVSTADAGIFSAALKVVFVLLMLDRILNAVFLPVATRYLSTRKDEAPFLISVVTKFVLIMILPITVCMILLSPAAISLIFGQSYVEAVLLLQILMGYFSLTLLNSLFVCALIGAGRERDYTFAMNAGSSIFVAGILIGTIILGAKGAAIGVVVGELCTVMLMWLQLRKTVAMSLWNAVARPLLACCAMVGTILLLREQTVILQVLVSFSVFVITLIVLKGIEEKEIQFLRERLV